MKQIRKLYKKPKGVGWLGWIETARGRVTGFIKLNGEIVGWDSKRKVVTG